MALPKLTRPEYSTTVPSTGKKIKYHPFTVREEKVLMLAAEGQDPEEICNAVTNVLEKCVTTTGFKVSDLALFDVEYLFLKARAKSVGEVIEVTVADPDYPDVRVEHEINIDRIGIKKDKTHTDLIDLTDDIKIKMKYPDISFFTSGVDITNLGSSLEILTKCISSIIYEEEVFNREDMSNEEITTWLEDLSSDQYQRIMKFFTTMPKLSHTITAKNPDTGKDFSVTLEGLADFF